MTDKARTIQVYKVYIKAPAQAIWDAITRPEWTAKWGYGGQVEYDLKKGGKFAHHPSAEMKAVGMPEDMIVGEVIESDPPRRLVQTWHPHFNETTAAEQPTRLTYEIAEWSDGTCSLTVIHDVTGAPSIEAMVPGGGDPNMGGGGWPWALSDLKSLLETGRAMAAA